MWSYLLICLSKSPRRFLLIFFLPCVFHSNAPFWPQLAASRVGQPASIWKWRNWEDRDHSVEHRDRAGCRWWGNRKRPSASSLFVHWLRRCFSHLIFIFWFGAKSLNQKTKLIQSPNPHWALVWTILKAVSLPGWRDGANKWWTQSCRFTDMRIEKW